MKYPVDVLDGLGGQAGLAAILLSAIDAGVYTAPSKMTVKDWLDIWTADYLSGVKPATVVSYKGHIKNHIIPALGAIKLEALNPHSPSV